MREATTKSLQACLATDFRIAQRLMLQADYFEGVRALLVDKDGRPRWSPATLDDVDPRAIDAFFAPLAAGYEMTFP
jgi:enoyl-CoA hydratase